jgi:hypothetical protein
MGHPDAAILPGHAQGGFSHHSCGNRGVGGDADRQRRARRFRNSSGRDPYGRAQRAGFIFVAIACGSLLKRKK